MPNKPHKRWRASVAIQARARELRHQMTPAERKLWQRIRDGQLDGAHIRKQHAVGYFIVDFFCAKAKLVIEIDGDTHAEQVEYDEERTRWLNEQKQYRVIRFTNDDVMHSLDAVVEAIREVLNAPIPSPSPAVAGEGSPHPLPRETGEG
jgi:very-short-patch-repair endonuclease